MGPAGARAAGARHSVAFVVTGRNLMSSELSAELAAEAYVYGFPLVFDLQEVGRFTRSGMGSVPATESPAAVGRSRSVDQTWS